MKGTGCYLGAGVVVMLVIAANGATQNAAIQVPAIDESGSEQKSKGACLQVLKPTDKALRFTQHTSRERILSELTRKLVTGARKLDKGSASSLNIDTTGENVEEKVGFHVLRARSGIGSHPCFEIAYEILDVDECADPSFKACHSTARCRNTNGSYECDCPGGMVGQEGACAGLTTTATAAGGCNCQSAKCKLSLRCAVPDACGGRCVPEAACETGRCVCPPGFFGNGVRCHNAQRLQAVFDRNGTLHGPSRVEEDYCGCQPRRVDYCIGVTCRPHSVCQSLGSGYKCRCEEGFEEGEGGECVDTKTLRLVMLGEARMVLEQGDAFEDPFVIFKDENRMGEKTRSIGVRYDPALQNDTLDEVGEYHVHYSIVANWTSQKTVSLTRTVVVKDIDECRLPPRHPKHATWHHLCDPTAQCVNTLGGYECHCPPGSVGDGAMSLGERQRRPGNFRNGSGCVDTRPPVLELAAGQGPRVLTVCKCEALGGGGPGGPLGGGPSSSACPRRDYRHELQRLLEHDASYLCPAGHAEREKKPQQPCARAYKPQWGSQVDLTKSIVVGPVEPVRSDGASHLFRVPLDVTGPKGSRAETKYAEILVQEVPLSKLKGGDKDKAPLPSSASALQTAQGELEQCRRAKGQLEQRIKILEAEKQRLLQRAAVSQQQPPAAAGGATTANETRREGEQRRHIAALLEQLSECKDRGDGSCPAPPPPPPPPVPPPTTGDGSAWTLYVLLPLLALSVVVWYFCLQQPSAPAVERPPRAPNARFQESPSPARTRGPDRTPGSPVRPLRGHVNLHSRTPLMSPLS